MRKQTSGHHAITEHGDVEHTGAISGLAEPAVSRCPTSFRPRAVRPHSLRRDVRARRSQTLRRVFSRLRDIIVPMAYVVAYHRAPRVRAQRIPGRRVHLSGGIRPRERSSPHRTSGAYVTDVESCAYNSGAVKEWVKILKNRAKGRDALRRAFLADCGTYLASAR